jgi:hypothetical protein
MKAIQSIFSQQQFRSFAVDFKSTFSRAAASKGSLKEFFKYTHPDMFGKAPQTIRDVNAESTQ